MEKGTLIIIKTAKGYVAKIRFSKKDGSTGELPISAFKPNDDKYHNTPCEFLRKNGQLVKLMAHDGKTLFRKQEDASGVQDSFDPRLTRLPEDTRNALAFLDTPDNFNLKLNKGARYDAGKDKFQFFKRDKKGENYEIKADFGQLNFRQLAERQLDQVRRIYPSENVGYLDLAVDWRMALGLGNESVYETSLALHHVYGFPYVPASALKGVVRSWIISESFGRSEGKAIQDNYFCKLFGCPGELLVKSENKKYASFPRKAQKGSVVFFDAFPLDTPLVEFDIMNPHFGPYYSDPNNEKPPADYYSPIPVPFITVGKTDYRFIIASADQKLQDNQVAGKQVMEWLSEALTQHGIGAKTAVGYGYMKPR